MSETTTAAANVVTKWLKDFFIEYSRENLFFPYMGQSHNNPIVIKEGKQIVSIPLVSQLSGDGVEGDATLDGNEEIQVVDYHSATQGKIIFLIPTTPLTSGEGYVEIRSRMGKPASELIVKRLKSKLIGV